ncbi:FecR domain-containing protein [Pseudomonas sp. NY15181]|uniref:FecR domain-containing protein n=1 Tax=Pseudomonas sp. NY15181 TaxID=3400349 RepID=UPI003A8A542C
MNPSGAIDAAPRLEHAVVEQAIGWRVRLASGMAAADEIAACQRWRASDPAHEQAWQRLEFFDGRLAGIAPGVASCSLRRAAVDPARRRALKSLLLLAGTAAVVGSAGLGLRDSSWLAQQRTSVGERRRIALPDGGWLQLNTDSAVDIVYDSQIRRVRLYSGEMLVQTATDGAGRAFWVDTPLGRLQALGTRFAVRLDGSEARLSVQEGAVAVTPALRDESAGVIEAGRQVRFDRKGLYGETALDADSLAWSDGYLVARQWTLGRLCAELARYRAGVLRCDPAVADLAISGVFPLDRPEQAIAALQRSLPVRAQYRTRWWVTLVPLA